MTRDDGEFVGRVADALSCADSDSLNENQRAIVLAWQGYGLWSCGGFEDVIGSGYDLAEIARALRKVGLTAAAHAFADAAKTRDEKEWERAEKPVYRMEAQVPRALARFIEAHRRSVERDVPCGEEDPIMRLASCGNLAVLFLVRTSAEGLVGAFTHKLPLRGTTSALAKIGARDAAALLRRAAALPASARTLMDARMQALDAGLIMLRDRLRERIEASAAKRLARRR